MEPSPEVLSQPCWLHASGIEKLVTKHQQAYFATESQRTPQLPCVLFALTLLNFSKTQLTKTPGISLMAGCVLWFLLVENECNTEILWAVRPPVASSTLSSWSMNLEGNGAVLGLFYEDYFQRGRQSKQIEKNPQCAGHRCVGVETGWEGEGEVSNSRWHNRGGFIFPRNYKRPMGSCRKKGDQHRGEQRKGSHSKLCRLSNFSVDQAPFGSLLRTIKLPLKASSAALSIYVVVFCFVLIENNVYKHCTHCTLEICQESRF